MQLTHLKVAQLKPGALEPQVCLCRTVSFSSRYSSDCLVFIISASNILSLFSKLQVIYYVCIFNRYLLFEVSCFLFTLSFSPEACDSLSEARGKDSGCISKYLFVICIFAGENEFWKVIGFVNFRFSPAKRE